jgi:hypothetical protein
MIDTVVPGKFETVAYRPVRRPKTTLFPTFGFPTSAMRRGLARSVRRG